MAGRWVRSAGASILALAVAVVLLALPPKAALAASSGSVSAAESVITRAWVHEGFARLVFEWKRPVGYTARIEGRQLTVRFDRPFKASHRPFLRYLKGYVRGAERLSNGRGVRFSLAGDFRLKSFTEGGVIALDLLAGNGTARPRKSGPPHPPIRLRAGEHDGFSRLALDWKGPVGYAVSRRGSTVTIAFDRRAKIDVRKVRADLPRWVKNVSAAPRRGGVALVIDVAKGARLQHFRDGHIVAVDVLRPKSGGSATAKAGSPGNARKPRPLVKAARFSVAPVDDGGALALRFDWGTATGAAVFRRGGYLWLVFDNPLALDPQRIHAAGGAIVEAAEQIPNSRFTVLRLRTGVGINPTLRHEGTAWVIDLRPRALEPRIGIEVAIRPDSVTGTQVFLAVEEAGPALRIHDPEVGDDILVIPVLPLGQGLFVAHEYVDFRLPVTAQGIVVEPRIEALALHHNARGVAITDAAGLHVSNPTDLPAGAGTHGGETVRVFEFANWRRVGARDFQESKEILQHAAFTLPQPERGMPRLELAQFYFANGFAREAIGLFRLIERDDPETAAAPEFRFLRGAASLLAGDLASAARDLRHPVLEGREEVGLWRAALDARNGDWKKAHEGFIREAALLDTYPRLFKNRFLLLAAEAAISVGDVAQADLYLKRVLVNDPRPSRQAMILYLQGLLKKKLDEPEEADQLWQQAARSGDREVRAKAEYARVLLGLERNELPAEKAIERLERLRFAWRGDRFEFNLLRRLGELYLGREDYRHGLQVLRQAVAFFPESTETRVLAQRMNDAFNRLFLDGGADKLPPIAALALYNEFRELSPVGKQGDEMIRHLADRLVAIDLLGKAAELLDHQVDYRLSGVDKARVGMHLALVRLLGKEPQAALEGLRKSEVAGIPLDLMTKRRHLKARALADLGRDDKALTLLGKDNSREAELLRADIYWKQRNWRAAAQAYAHLLDGLDGAAKAFDEAAARLVLNRAVALVLAQDRTGLAELRRRFGPHMANTPLADAFRLIASADGDASFEAASITREVNIVENFQTFLTSYRTQAKSGRLSAIN
jgi:tetratricopeptide (TPR) repeat protein